MQHCAESIEIISRDVSAVVDGATEHNTAMASATAFHACRNPVLQRGVEGMESISFAQDAEAASLTPRGAGVKMQEIACIARGGNQ